MTDTSYRFSLDLKVSQIKGADTLKSIFPNLEDVIIGSEPFDSLESIVTSLNNLITEIVIGINLRLGEERYGVMSELNPAKSGVETISKEWGSNEMAKVWIIDKIENNSGTEKISAAGLAQILELSVNPETVN